MIRLALRVTLALAWVLAGVFAFAVVQARAVAGPLQSDVAVTVTDWSGGGSAQDFYARFERLVSDSGAVIAREVADVTEGRAIRHLFVAADADAEALVASRQDFGGAVRTVVHPWEELGNRSPVGRYDLFVEPAALKAVSRFLADNGMRAQYTKFGLRDLMSAEWYLPLLGLLVLCAGLGGAYTVSAIRATSVMRLHGWGSGRILLAQLGDYLPWWAGCGAGMSGLGWIVLTATGQPGSGLFLMAMLATATVALAAALLAQVTVGMLMATVSIPGSLRGELPRWALTFATYSMRVTAAVIALSTAASTLTLAQSLHEVRQNRLVFDRAGNWSTATLGDAYTLADQDRLAGHVGAWAKSLDREGHVLVSVPLRLQGSVGLEAGGHWLVVNHRYLKEQSLVKDNGEAITAPRDQVVVSIPELLWGRRGEIVRGLGLGGLLQRPTRPVSLVKAGFDQKLFTYALPEPGTTTTMGALTYIDNPVVVVLPELDALRDDAAAAFVSTGGVMFERPEIVTSSIDGDTDLQRFVKATTPISSGIAGVVTDLQSRLRLAFLGLLIAFLVVALSGYAAALVAVRRSSQLIFVRYVHGWRFCPTHRAGLAVEAGLLALVVGWIPLQIWKARAQFEALVATGAAPPLSAPSISGGQWIAIASLAAALCAGYLIPLRQMHRKVIASSFAYR